MPKQTTYGGMNYANDVENQARSKFIDLFNKSPLPDDAVLPNLGLFLNSKTLSRLLFMDFMYRQAIDLQGVIMDFGTRWGQNMSLFAALRAIYEPYNRHKKIIGFDTFDGFPSVGERDGNSEMIFEGNISVTDNYLEYLDQIMKAQEGDNPLAHIKKYDFVVGDACKGIYDYLEEYPETIVAMAFFDFDL